MNSAAPKGRAVVPMPARSGLQTSAAGWKRIAQSSQFQHLMRTKKAFILPAFLFFAAYCLLMPLLTAYAPRAMGAKMAGVSVAYWYGLSVILLAWVVVWLYVKAAAGFDLQARDIVAEARRAKKSE